LTRTIFTGTWLGFRSIKKRSKTGCSRLGGAGAGRGQAAQAPARRKHPCSHEKKTSRPPKNTWNYTNKTIPLIRDWKWTSDISNRNPRLFPRKEVEHPLGREQAVFEPIRSIYVYKFLVFTFISVL